MTKCADCGRRTNQGRRCKRCAADRHRENRDQTITWADCPTCGGITSGEGVECAECRRTEGQP